MPGTRFMNYPASRTRCNIALRSLEVPEGGGGGHGAFAPHNGIIFLTIKGIFHLRKMQFIFTFVL